MCHWQVLSAVTNLPEVTLYCGIITTAPRVSIHHRMSISCAPPLGRKGELRVPEQLDTYRTQVICFLHKLSFLVTWEAQIVASRHGGETQALGLKEKKQQKVMPSSLHDLNNYK